MRQALGRGLDALIPGGAKSDTIFSQGGVKKIPITSIKPSKWQARKNFDPEKLSELAQSIKQHGLAQPILVSFDENSRTYELIAGERRLRASQLAGLQEIEVVVRPHVSDKDRLMLGLIENLQRDDLNPVEEANGYIRLMKEFTLSQAQLSETLGKSRSAISNTLRLLDLPEEVQKALQFNQITEGHARALLGIKNSTEIINVFRIIAANKMSVREVEDHVRRMQGGGRGKDKKIDPAQKASTPDIKALEHSLQQHLGTRVQIKLRKDQSRGALIIHFYGLSDFDRVLGIIKK